jgi:hypothetical protein
VSDRLRGPARSSAHPAVVVGIATFAPDEVVNDVIVIRREN